MSDSDSPREYETLIGSGPIEPLICSGVQYLLSKSLTDDDVSRIRNILKLITNNDKGCRECINRLIRMIGWYGLDGPIMHHDMKLTIEEEKMHPYFKDLMILIQDIYQRPGDVVPIILYHGIFPPMMHGGFPHPTVESNQYTDPEMMHRFNDPQLKQSLNGTHDSRIGKLLCADAMRHMLRIRTAQQQLDRPAHWNSVLKWVDGLIQEMIKYAPSWNELTQVQIIHMHIFALATGRVGGSIRIVNLDYQQAKNIVDFYEIPDIRELCRTMDTLSDPSTYMQSQVNKQLLKLNIDSKIGVTLVWHTPDDLDLQVECRRSLYSNALEKVYFGNKVGWDARLDHDANIDGKDPNPIENITLTAPGFFKIQVNLYTRRTFREPIKFSIIVRIWDQSTVLEFEWPVDRVVNNIMTVHEIEITADDMKAPELKLSEKEAKRVVRQQPGWSEHFGNPVPRIATIADLKPTDVWIRQQAPAPAPAPAPTSANNYLFDMARCKLDTAEPPPLPLTVSDLVGLQSVIEVDPMDCSIDPGYAVIITTPSQVLKHSGPIPVSYTINGHSPAKPVLNTDEKTTPSRFTSECFSYHQGLVKVSAIVRINEFWFLVLDGAVLPSGPDFPTGGGFYSVDLSPDFHDYRSLWGSHHTLTLPVVKPSNDLHLIGGWATNRTLNVYIDGKLHTVST